MLFVTPSNPKQTQFQAGTSLLISAAKAVHSKQIVNIQNLRALQCKRGPGAGEAVAGAVGANLFKVARLTVSLVILLVEAIVTKHMAAGGAEEVLRVEGLWAAGGFGLDCR